MAITYLDEQPVKSKITYLDEQPKQKTIKLSDIQTGPKNYLEAIGQTIETPAAAVRSAILPKELGGRGYVTGATQPETIPTFSQAYEKNKGLLPKPLQIAGDLANIHAKGMVGASVPEQMDVAVNPLTWLMSAGMLRSLATVSRVGRMADTGVKATEEAVMTPVRAAGRGIERTGALVSGVEPEVLAETRVLGYRNVLNKKYYNKKVPEQIIDTIDQNIEGLKTTASQKYNEVTTPIRQQKFDYNLILNDLNKLSLKLKQNPFKGPTKGLDTRIVETLRSPNLKVRTLGDVLDLRRNLDQELFTAKGQGIKSAYGKEVRDIFNKYLHKNEVLAKADNEWYTLQRILEDNQKVIGESGESYLNRWSKLTTKQKENLSLLEDELLRKNPEAKPFVSDLTNYSLAQNYLSKASQAGPVGLLGKVTRPIFRAYLRGLGTQAKPPFKTLPTP